MLKHLKTWLASVIREELDRTETTAAQEIARLENKFTLLIGALSTHVELHAAETAEDVKDHAVGIAANLHEKIAADAKSIAEMRRSTRMSCSKCGQRTWLYDVNRVTGTILCFDCVAKGLPT